MTTRKLEASTEADPYGMTTRKAKAKAKANAKRKSKTQKQNAKAKIGAAI
jgi:hypothetical protein